MCALKKGGCANASTGESVHRALAAIEQTNTYYEEGPDAAPKVVSMPVQTPETFGALAADKNSLIVLPDESALVWSTLDFAAALPPVADGATSPPRIAALELVCRFPSNRARIVLVYHGDPGGADTTVHWHLVGWLSVGSIPGVLVGTWIFIQVLGTDEASETIRTWIGWVLVAAVAAMIAKVWVGRRASGIRATHHPAGIRMPVRPIPTVILGVVVGLLVGMTSVGSGSLVVTALLLLYPLLRPSILVGTDLTQAVPMLVVGAIAHAGFGEISIAVVASLLLGQIPGVWLGARMSSRYDGTALRWLLMVLLAATAVKLLGASTIIAGMIGLVGLIIVGAVYVRERIDATAQVTAEDASGRSVPSTATEVS